MLALIILAILSLLLPLHLVAAEVAYNAKNALSPSRGRIKAGLIPMNKLTVYYEGAVSSRHIALVQLKCHN